MNNEERKQIIHERLTAAFQPIELTVIDDSQHHIGHAGAQSGAGHFTVKIKATAFDDKSRVAAHQMVYKELNDMIGPEIHALSIKII